MLMAKGYRLRPYHLGVGDVRRPLQFKHRPEQRSHQKYSAINRGAGNCVRTAMKNLHRSELSVQRRRPYAVSGLFLLLPTLVRQSQTSVILQLKTRDYNSSWVLVIAPDDAFSKNFMDNFHIGKAAGALTNIASPFLAPHARLRMFLYICALVSQNRLTAGSSPTTLVRSSPRSRSASLRVLVPSL